VLGGQVGHSVGGGPPPGAVLLTTMLSIGIVSMSPLLILIKRAAFSPRSVLNPVILYGLVGELEKLHGAFIGQVIVMVLS
jgi:hypothetical protein